MIAFAAWVAVALGQTSAPDALSEVFVDRGETFVRAGQIQGLAKGMSVDVVSAPSGKPLGSATVMEVWDSMARLSLDTLASAYSGQQWVRLAARLAQTAGSGTGAVSVPLPAPPPMTAVGARKALKGRVSLSAGALDARRVIVANDDAFDWHGCRVTLADGRSFRMGPLRAGADEGIMMFRFDPGEHRDPQGLVAVSCDEGEGRFAVTL